MSTLVKSIIETKEINNLKPDFSVLKIIPKDIARQSQTLIFSSPNKHSLQLLTTNNFPEQSILSLNYNQKATKHNCFILQMKVSLKLSIDMKNFLSKNISPFFNLKKKKKLTESLQSHFWTNSMKKETLWNHENLSKKLSDYLFRQEHQTFTSKQKNQGFSLDSDLMECSCKS